MANRTGKMQNLINYRMKVILNDGRQMTGQMLAFDKHMNIVLADTEEFRRSRKRQNNSAPGSAAAPVVEADEKRSLGLLIIRGTNIISCSVEGPPPADPAARLGGAASGPAAPVMAAGPGITRPVGRGAGGLQGPAVGVGGPGFGFPPSGGPPGFGAPPGFPGRGGPPGFQPPPGFQAPPGGRGFQPPPGFGR